MPQWLEPLGLHQAKAAAPEIFQTIAADGRPGGLVALVKAPLALGPAAFPS
jgi:hypothetical protein